MFLLGCGSLPCLPNQHSWKVIWLDGKEEEWNSNISIVYHVYIPVCQFPYRLTTQQGYRCGENKQWNSTNITQCKVESMPKTTLEIKYPGQLQITHPNLYMYICNVVFLLYALKRGIVLIMYNIENILQSYIREAFGIFVPSLSKQEEQH